MRAGGRTPKVDAGVTPLWARLSGFRILRKLTTSVLYDFPIADVNGHAQKKNDDREPFSRLGGTAKVHSKVTSKATEACSRALTRS